MQKPPLAAPEPVKPAKTAVSYFLLKKLPSFVSLGLRNIRWDANMSEWSYSQRQCTLGSKSGKHSWIIKLNNLDQLLAILWKIEVQSDAHLRPSYCESDGGRPVGKPRNRAVAAQTPLPGQRGKFARRPNQED